MKKYLIYVRAFAGKQTSEDYLSGYNQAYMLERFAQFRHWNTIGCIVDNVESLKCNAEASFDNLCRYLENRNDIDVVITAELEQHSWVDSSAIEAILDRKKIKLIPISICPKGNDYTDKSPAAS